MNEKYWHYEQCIKGGTKACPQCGKRMVVEWDDIVMASLPPQQRWGWWCGCGHRELAGIHVHKSEEDLRREKWEEANTP
jgi:hypothetical protein